MSGLVCAIPLAITLREQALIIRWADGETSLAAHRLRAECRCAECQRITRSGGELALADDLGLLGATPVGHYALQLHFSDQHQRGIYPWAYLRELSARESNDRELADHVGAERPVNALA